MLALGVREVVMKRGAEQVFILSMLTWTSPSRGSLGPGLGWSPCKASGGPAELGWTLKSPMGEARRQQVTQVWT